MKKSRSHTQNSNKAEIARLKLMLDSERAMALSWEEQGQFGTIHHDRIKLYSKALAQLEADVEYEGQGSEVNATSK